VAHTDAWSQQSSIPTDPSQEVSTTGDRLSVGSEAEITWILGEVGDVSPAVYRARIDLENGGEGLSLPDPAVLDGNRLVRGGRHEAPLEHPPAALAVALDEGGREGLVAPKAAVELQPCLELGLARDGHHRRYQHMDGRRVLVAPRRESLVDVLGKVAKRRVVQEKLAGGVREVNK
jgi:hypothetical protein